MAKNLLKLRLDTFSKVCYTNNENILQYITGQIKNKVWIHQIQY